MKIGMRQELREMIRATNAKWDELKRDGYTSGGYDRYSGKIAICKGERPHNKIVGWLDPWTLEIIWL